MVAILVELLEAAGIAAHIEADEVLSVHRAAESLVAPGLPPRNGGEYGTGATEVRAVGDRRGGGFPPSWEVDGWNGPDACRVQPQVGE